MSNRKLYAFVAATLIASSGFAGVAAYADSAVRAATSVPAQATAVNIQTLPTITVRPSQEEIRRALGTDAHDSNAAVGPDFGMPYYSFAADRHVGSR